MNNYDERLTKLTDFHTRLTRGTDSADSPITAQLKKILGDWPCVEMLENLVKDYKAKVQELETKAIPELMQELDLKKIQLQNGIEVKLDSFMSVSQSGKDSALLASWLIKHGYDAIIADTLSFGKGELKPELVKELQERGLSFDQESKINSASLKSVLKSHLEQTGELPPAEAVAVESFTKAVIKRKTNV